MRHPIVSTKEQIVELRLQVDELDRQMTDWRRHLAWQEEIAFFAAKAEELGRRLSSLEKRVAHEQEAETIEIRFSAERPVPIT